MLLFGREYCPKFYSFSRINIVKSVLIPSISHNDPLVLTLMVLLLIMVFRVNTLFSNIFKRINPLR